MITESEARNVLVCSQQANGSFVGVEKFVNNANVDKVITVEVRMFFSIFTEIEKYFGFVLSEKDKLLFEVFFIKGLLVFALMVWVEGCFHLSIIIQLNLIY